MQRLRKIAQIIVAAGLAGWGYHCLKQAAQLNGASAASPALLGIVCLIVAGCLVAPLAVKILAAPLMAFIDAIFNPGDRLTALPDSMLITLNMRIQEGKLDWVESQLTALMDAYRPQPELYHLQALLTAARGDDLSAVSRKAKRALSRAQFTRYQALLQQTPPAPRPNLFDSGR
jgi:hypothetical protein